MELCARCDPSQFDFETTAALPPPDEPFGQARAVDAVALGLDIAARGYNLFVLGRPGSSRHDVVKGLLQAHAARRPRPTTGATSTTSRSRTGRARCGCLPGEGSRLRTQMQGFAGEVGKAIEVAFESDEYRSRLEAIEKEYKQREEQARAGPGPNVRRRRASSCCARRRASPSRR